MSTKLEEVGDASTQWRETAAVPDAVAFCGAGAIIALFLFVLEPH